MRLYTFTISHFSEKARWALDWAGLDYDERRLTPGLHLPRVRAMAPKSTVPVLVHGGRAVQGSSDILDYLQTHFGTTALGPSDARSIAAARELEARVDRAFGLGVQRIAYHALLPERRVVTDLWSQDGPFYARAFYALAYPGVAKVVSRMYKTDAESVVRAKDRFAAVMDEIDDKLQRQPYVDGDRPGRGDITVAALLAPLCSPPGHIVAWPQLPESLSAFTRQLEDRPTMRHVTKMYREHRGRPVAAA